MLVSSNNAALSKIADVLSTGDIHDSRAILDFCQTNKAEIAIVLSPKALVDGVVDLLQSAGVRVLAPSKRVAELDNDRSLIRKALSHGRASAAADFASFTSSEGLENFLDSMQGNYAIKPLVKSSGKPVKVAGSDCSSKAECMECCKELLAQGQAVVVEKLQEGQEFSILTFSDGQSYLHAPPVQVYTRCYVNDSGPLVSGVGCVGGEDLSLPFLEPRDLEDAKRQNEEVFKSIKEITGEAYRGPLCVTYTAGVNAVHGIDLQVNFGLFESLAMLSRAKFDVVGLLASVLEGKLSSFKGEFESAAVVMKSIFPFGFPLNTQQDVSVDVSQLQDNSSLLLDNVREENGKLLAVGTSAAVLVGTGPSIASAEKVCEAAVRKIPGSVFHRPDIGTASSIAARTESQRKLRRIKIGVVGSTRGSSLQPILYAIHDGRLNAEISVVVSNVASSYILQRARVNNIKAVHIPGKGRQREEFDRDVTAALRAEQVDIVMLIGFMRIVSGEFCREWHGKLLNVHPSLLPKHANLMDIAVHQSVLDAGDTETGCTVHQVVEEVDGGDAVVQMSVPVLPSDTAETLKSKVQALEGESLIRAAEMFYRDRKLPGAEKEDCKKQKVAGGDKMAN